MFQVGQIVTHAKHGTGRVLALLPGRRVRVRFDASPVLPRTVPAKDLRPVGADTAGEQAPSPPADARPPAPPALAAEGPGTAERLEALHVLSALRSGVVPGRGVRRYAVGMEPLERQVGEWLATLPAFRVIEGDFGRGKSLSLSYFRERVLEEGFAVALIQLDPELARWPVRLWQLVCANLELPGGERGIMSLLRLVRERAPQVFEEADARDYSPQLSPLAYAAASEAASISDLEVVASFVLGEPDVDRDEVRRVLSGLGWRGSLPYKFPTFRTVGQVLSHNCSTLACWCEQVGFKGFVLLVDEGERADVLTDEDRVFVARTIVHLIDVTEGMVKGWEPIRGGHKRLRELPNALRRDHPFLVVVADTPNPEVGVRALLRRWGANGLTTVHVPELGPARYRELARRLAALYREAHPGAAVEDRHAQAAVDDLVAELGPTELSPRTVVKEVLYALDEALHDRPSSHRPRPGSSWPRFASTPPTPTHAR